MPLRQYLIDAFASEVFRGNPAAVCATPEPLAASLMQSIAIENNYSETAFLVERPTQGPEDARYLLRWFTPGGEVDLCGHATLASAFTVSRFLRPGAASVVFETLQAGELPVTVDDGWVSMDLPAFRVEPVPVTDAMERAFGVRPLEAYLGRDLLCVLPSAQAVTDARPDEALLLELPGLGQDITAASDEAAYDCVSRCFAPKLKVYEDPVTGSSHCAIAPFWAARLGRDEIVARQASARGGVLRCHVQAERVIVAGPAVAYRQTELFV